MANITPYINTMWDKSIIPTLMDYIRIPNKSPHFDPHWQQNGYMDKAVTLLTNWCITKGPKDMVLEIKHLPGRTPLIYIEIPGQLTDTILLYGHLDKQPEMTGWDKDLDPWQPVLRENKLYGRGGADDGYAIFASLSAICALRNANLPHARCVILIEACEESGSYDLPYYIDALKQQIGDPDLVICLDSGCGNYEQLWVTTSLRGLCGGILSIDVLKEGIHSGTGSGTVPANFLILRQLLDRIEDKKTGAIILKELITDIPTVRLNQTKQTSEILGQKFYNELPFASNTKPVSNNVFELLLNRSWRSALSIVGADGLPPSQNAGNVTLPSLSLKLSMRLAPTINAKKASILLKETLEKTPPFDAKITFTINEIANGWNAPSEEKWLTSALDKASQHYFGKTHAYMGEGGSIPFMGMLGEKFPKAQFFITGVLGPKSNAHGPNEFLHIPMGKKLTACVAEIIHAHYEQKARGSKDKNS